MGPIGEGLSGQLELLFFPPEGQSEAAWQRVNFWGTFFRSQDDKCHKIARWQGPLFLGLYDKCRIFGDKSVTVRGEQSVRDGFLTDGMDY